MKDRMLRTKYQFPVIFCIFTLLIPLLFSACLSTPRERKLEGFIIVHTQDGDSPESLAGQYLNHPSEQRRILDFNGIDSVVSGRDIAIPLKPFKPGGITPEGYQIVPVLAYNRFSGPKPSPGSRSASAFENQMEYLKSNDYRVITPDQLFSFFRLQEQLHDQSVLLIFDSTDRSIHDDIFPVLQKYGFPAVLFITPDQVGKENMLNWGQILYLSENGMDIQCRIRNGIYQFPSNGTFYSYFHKLKKEIDQAAALMETNLRQKCRLFLYPPGDHVSLLVHILQKQGFEGAFVDQEGENPFFTDPFTIHFTQVSRDRELMKFKTQLKVFQNSQ